MAELKPCPFCGGKPTLMDFVQRWFFREPKVYYYVQCCCCGGRSGLDENALVVAERWNRRAEDGK